MKSGSIGDMPPSTRGIDGFSARMASAAAITVSPNRVQSGSTSGSQWDLLFGSFQIIAASIMRSVLNLSRHPRPALGAEPRTLGR